MKPVVFDADSLNEFEVVFNVRFWLDDGEHGGYWVWNIRKGHRGQWEFDHSQGSGVRQPPIENTR